MAKEIAQVVFEAYNQAGANPGKTWDGKDVPRWEDLGPEVTTKWRAAASQVVAVKVGEAATFGWALQMLRGGKKVAREGWNGKGMWLALQVPDEHSKMSLPYIYMRTAGGQLVPWLASQTDMLGEDWVAVE